MSRLRILIFATEILICANYALAQDVLRADRIKSLRGLSEIRLLVRPTVQIEVISLRELSDHVSVLLRQKIPALKQADQANSWLVIEYNTHERGGSLGLSVHRFATVSGVQEMSFVKVWDDHKLILGGGGDVPAYKRLIKDITDEILTSLAADYYRANP